MFTPTDKEKKAFLERTRADRQRREAERLEKQLLDKKDKAARIVQKWWRQQTRLRRASQEAWSWWDHYLQQQNLSLDDCFRLAGIYHLLSHHHPSGVSSSRLADICKCLVKKYNNMSYYALLVDRRYRTLSLKYLCFIIDRCFVAIGAFDDKQQQMYLSGPELSILLQFLNPKMYQQTNKFLDTRYLVPDHPMALTNAAYTVLDQCLLNASIRDPAIARVQRIVKLEQKSAKYSAGVLSPDDGKAVRAIQLWLTTVTRLCLFPLEFASNDDRRRTAVEFICRAILTIPLLPAMINLMMASHLMKLISINDVYAAITRKSDKTITEMISGNGCLFVLGNMLHFVQQQPLDASLMVALANTLLDSAQNYFSERQYSMYKHYHPLFKWSASTWGDSIDANVFERVQRQIEYLWSRGFMDNAFAGVLAFDSRSASSKKEGSKNDVKMRLFKRKQQEELSIVDSKQYSQLAEFSMDIEAIFTMYMTLASLFASQRKEVMNRIAFTPRLMPQLWRIMNTFGPRGHMTIYLDAARRPDGDVDSEPLIKILKAFCEACSLVFLTLDDTDIFEDQQPFSVKDLIQLGGFLNAFYFALLHQQTKDIRTTTESSTPTLPPSVRTFRAAHRLLLQIYDLDVRHPFCPEQHWLLVSDPMAKSSLLSLFTPSKATTVQPFLDRLRQGDPVPLRILQLMPHTVPFNTRLTVFRDWVGSDRVALMATSSRAIRVRRQNVLEDGFRGLSGLPPSAWKGTIRVKFVNDLGMEEAGIDQGGPFKDFVSLLVADVFKPSIGLFSSTSTNNLCYPAPTSYIQGPHHIQLFEFIGKVIGKAVYEGILLDVQFASFFLAKLLGRNVFLEELRELDEDVWRNLIFLKRYDGDVEDLGLCFATDEDAFGTVTTHELKYHGRNIAVTNDNKVEYIYRMADYKLNQQTREQTRAFINGFRSVISEAWIRVFSPPELQRVISGEDTDFDVTDLRQHTVYQNGYFDHHPIIRSLWQIVEDFSSEEKRAFLKFVTSCPKPPLGGFDYLQPPFTIRMVTVDPTSSQGTVDGLGLVKTLLKVGNSGGATKMGRLPTSSTCFNLLKLPAYTKKSLLREKLRYGKKF
ncbi:hypothetical protein BJV82DRAFT_210891 [Fennellomyces sp. T-0311]|nr:hypothetical protein BJV82DRAFT_210891 [Fennellomyces sp. T-0311]